MKELKILQDKAAAAYKIGGAEIKKMLEGLFDKKDLLLNAEDTCNSVKECVEFCGKDYSVEFSSTVHSILSPFELAVRQLTYIAEAYNGGTIDFADQSQKLWFPWVNRVSGCGLSLGDVFYDVSLTYVAPRLCFKEKSLAEKAFKKFPAVFEAYFKGVTGK